MKKSIAIIGGGSSALFLAAFLDSNLFDITIYEKNKALGRKFLVAGKGGFNLTHSEPIDSFVKKYTPPYFLRKSLLKNDNQCFIKWLNAIGIPTFIGSSKRVYPEKNIKPIEVFNTILSVLKKNKITIKTAHEWKGWTNNNELLFNANTIIKADYIIFCLGGGSWKITGSKGDWLSYFSQKNIKTMPFQASNCAFKINWETTFIKKHEGKPLKNIAIHCDKSIQKGEAVVTKFGIEGNAIYALSPLIRGQFIHNKKAFVFLDFKPMLTLESIQNKLQKTTTKSIRYILKNELKISDLKIDLLKTYLTKEQFTTPIQLASYIKKFPITLTDSAPLDEAISTIGGITLEEVHSNFELKKHPNHYCIGEMLDWDAPTGGYLLQACFSMGVSLAKEMNNIYS